MLATIPYAPAALPHRPNGVHRSAILQPMHHAQAFLWIPAPVPMAVSAEADTMVTAFAGTALVQNTVRYNGITV